MRSKPEEVFASLIKAQYEPPAVTYTASYIPDFLTPEGITVEVKEYLADGRERKRLREVAAQYRLERKPFIVCIHYRGCNEIKPVIEASKVPNGMKGIKLAQWCELHQIPWLFYNQHTDRRLLRQCIINISSTYC
jgi:hypothetical protein